MNVPDFMANIQTGVDMFHSQQITTGKIGLPLKRKGHGLIELIYLICQLIIVSDTYLIWLVEQEIANMWRNLSSLVFTSYWISSVKKKLPEFLGMTTFPIFTTTHKHMNHQHLLHVSLSGLVERWRDSESVRWRLSHGASAVNGPSHTQVSAHEYGSLITFRGSTMHIPNIVSLNTAILNAKSSFA